MVVARKGGEKIPRHCCCCCGFQRQLCCCGWWNRAHTRGGTGPDQGDLSQIFDVCRICTRHVRGVENVDFSLSPSSVCVSRGVQRERGRGNFPLYHGGSSAVRKMGRIGQKILPPPPGRVCVHFLPGEGENKLSRDKEGAQQEQTRQQLLERATRAACSGAISIIYSALTRLRRKGCCCCCCCRHCCCCFGK